ncbi:hypothetical protein KPL37_10145 [Clostridium frigoris]|uniref:Cation-transporting P-type ATPase N-terminal domain-containing protein n=1 Tax=Clostridium frigoris TaxID=205327 RepID=A0ABS6BT65_9CLOT|nr:cation-transporting P-type ATPase [Clostridium frigoris]MBU3160114.1 hypothetical protein [Clostridium frigoris]
MKKWYGKTMTKVIKMLNSDIDLGLDEEKIKYMRESYGENTILKPKTESLLTLIVNQIKQLWFFVSLACIAMLFYNKLLIIGCFVTLIIILSVMLLINGDYKEKKSLVAIDNLNTTQSNVKRFGKIIKINCEEMVVGDIVFLEKGRYVSADIRILECEDLKVVEVSVTGEKYEVEKYSMKIEEEVVNLSEIKNIVFKSSFITEGSGLGIIIATGMNTQIGKIIKVLLESKNNSSSFSNSLTKVVNRGSIITLIVGLITLIFTTYKNNGIHETVNSLIYISMTFNSSMFIIILYLFFYIFFSKLNKKNIYVKSIATIYTLTNISAIFMKKIGAVSENRLILCEVYCDGRHIDMKDHKLETEEAIEKIISIALLCNDSKLFNKSSKHLRDLNSIENLEEHEILEFWNKNFAKNSKIETKHRRIFKIAYDSDKRIKTVVNKIDDKYRANVKGVLDGMLSRCTHILINGVEKEINEDDIVNIINVHIDMSNKAYNVTGYAYRNFSYKPSIDENIESNLVFVGLIGFENPIKKNSYIAVNTCRKIDIRVIIDQEDNKLASFAFGELIGLTCKKEEILSGIEMDYMSKDEFEKNIENVSIFSKISPKHKSEIVSVLNEKGHSIASVGDTLTDLEYLNKSDISISVGSECSNVVKKLSNIFLEENDFGDIVNLIQDSKKIINNISRVVLFISTLAVSEIFIILLSIIIKNGMPFTLISSLSLNFILLPCCCLAILLQNINTDITLKNIDYVYIKNISIRNSFVISIIYIFIIVIKHKFVIINVMDTIFIAFVLVENIFCLSLLCEKHFLKNIGAYTLVIFNLLLQFIFVILK